MSLYADTLVPEIRAILASSDLSRISAKGVRKQLVAKGHDEATIKQHRSDIDSRIEEIYEELTSTNDPDTPSSEDVPLNNSHPQSSQPEPLRVKTEVKKEPVSRPVKTESDQEMAARLQRQFDAEEHSGGRASRSGGAKPKKKAPAKKRKSKATVGSDNEDGAPKKKRAGGGGGAFNKELILSDALASLLGESKLSRPQTVKRIWEYVKGNDLQDQSDKRYILCDGPLQAVFHTEKLHMFTMNKILVDHLRDPDEIANLNGSSAPKVERKPAVDALPPPRAQLSSQHISSSEDDSDDDGY